MLAYSPPLHATASAQQDALNAALRLRIMRNCTLALPAAVYRRKPIPLCRLFEPSSVPLQRRTVRSRTQHAGSPTIRWSTRATAARIARLQREHRYFLSLCLRSHTKKSTCICF